MTIVASNSLTVSNVNDGSITHIAYANSADGTDGFTTVYPNLNLLTDTRDFKNKNVAESAATTSITSPGSTILKDGNDSYLHFIRSTQSQDWFRAYMIRGSSVSPNFPNVDVKPNSQYTFSVWLKGTGTHTIYAFDKWTTPNPTTLTVNLTDTWTKYVLTVNTATTMPTQGAQFFIRSSTVGSEINLKYPKVDPGSIATPYMPSSSEVTTADWPSFIGQYSDFTSTASTDPAKYAPWTVFKGNDGKDGANGKDGIAGKDGIGIQTTVITYAISTSGTTAPTTGWTSSIPSLVKGQYLWTKTVWTYTDNSSKTGYSVTYISKDGSNGDPGKVVSDTEPTTRFKGLTWKYSGTADLTASDGTVILSGTEYYWSGTNWILSEINAHNINGNNLTITDGEFSSTIIDGPVQIQTEIKDDHLLIYKMDTSHNEIHTIALKSDSGLAMTYQNSDTGEYTSAGVNFQGLFMQNNITNEFARLTPRGTDLSTDVPWTNLTLASGFSIGSGGKARYRVKNGVLYIHFRKIVCPALSGNQPNTLCYVPANGRASDGYDSFGVMSATNSTRIQYNDSGDGKVAIVPASNTTSGQGFNGFLICPMD
ncbi:hypothetical protein ACN9S9_05990 [Lactococcus lactis]